MRQFFLTGYLIFLFQNLFGQTFPSDPLKYSGFSGFRAHSLNYNLSIGTQFTSVSGYVSGITSFLTPHFSYTVNKRLRIGGGFSLSNTNYFNIQSFSTGESPISSNGNFTTATIFVNGQYLVNDRLTIYGSAFKQIPIDGDPLPYNSYYPVSRKGAQGININMDYRIGEHFHIQAGFRYTEGRRNDCFYPTVPFLSDPWNQTEGWFGNP